MLIPKARLDSTVVDTTAIQTLQNKTFDNTSTFPIFNQSTTGNAATATKLATARNITVALGSTAAASFDGTAAVTPGVLGTLPFGNGGTGATTQAAALTAITGSQTAGRYVRSDGTSASLSAIQAADVPTLNQSTTGTSANVTGTVAIANGGTGATSAALARAALGAAASGANSDITSLTGLTTPLSVSQGGTGANTLANNFVQGNGTSALTAVKAIPTGAVVGTTDTQTLTNKRRAPRVSSAASAATLTPEIDTFDLFTLTAQAAALTIANHSTSTPTDGEKIQIRILDNGTARAITYGTNYVARAGIALPATTVASKYLHLGFEWNAALGKYNLIALNQET